MHIDSRVAVVPRPREIWTRLAVDPIATPLGRWLAHRRGVTPNRVTAVAMLLAVGSAACFAAGALQVGGLLFLLRFFVDCLDGNVAREQGSSSARGGALDLAADVGGIALVAASLSHYLVSSGAVPLGLALALLASMVFYNWALAYRKALARRTYGGDGGADHTVVPTTPIVRTWVAFCRRLNMSPVPWAVEVEILVLGIAPVLLAGPLHVWTFAIGLSFYLLADVVNMRRIWNIAGDLDRGVMA